MGAHDDTRTFEAPNEAKAIEMAKRLMADARHEHGNDSYAGHIGIAAGVRVYRIGKPISEEKAYGLLFGTYGPGAKPGLAEKWGPAILIRIRNQGSRKARWMLGAMVAS